MLVGMTVMPLFDQFWVVHSTFQVDSVFNVYPMLIRFCSRVLMNFVEKLHNLIIMMIFDQMLSCVKMLDQRGTIIMALYWRYS